MAPYWPDGQPAWPEEMPLLETDIASAPRLSAFAFQRRFGFDLDLADLSAHLLATEQPTPDLVLPETTWRQRLRGVAATAAERIRESDTDVVFIPHGAEVVSRILAQVASTLGRRVLFWESGFFPGHLYLDPQAPHFFRGAARIDGLQLSSSPTPRARIFRDRWKAERQSKYPQNGGNHQALARWLFSDARPVLLLPGQVPTDANAVVGLGPFATLDDIYRRALSSIPSSWRVLYKPHPLAPRDPLAGTPSSDRFLSLDIDIHDAIEASDAVLVHSSNVGLEALLHGKPVLTLGRPIYAGRGLTIDLEHHGGLTASLETAAVSAPPEKAVIAFLDLILDEALLADGDGEMLMRRVEQAAPGIAQPSYLRWYGESVQALVQACSALHEALRTQVRLDRALETLSPEHLETLANRVGLDALEPHRFGGPAVARNRYAPPPMPDLDQALGVEAVYSDLRLEDCTDPAMVMASIEEGIIQVFSVPGPSTTPNDSIHAFSEDDLMHLARLVGLPARIGGLTDAEYAPSASARVWLLITGMEGAEPPQHGPVTFRRWHIPFEAFTLADSAQRPAADLITAPSTTKHAVYGPFISLPSGAWRAAWTPPRASNVFQHVQTAVNFVSGKRDALFVEWVEHIDAEQEVVARTLFATGTLDVITRANALYEFRTAWKGRGHRSHPLSIVGFTDLLLCWRGSDSSMRD